MSPVDHFSFGLLTPVLAYVMSSVGSMLGLLLTSRARLAGGREGKLWLVGAAFAIGGTGIWTMHFIAMLGFSVTGSVIRYDAPLTALSALIAVVVVGMGLFLVSYGGERLTYLLGGGVLTGCGVASMHYLGMYAMHVTVDAEPGLVAGADALDFLVPLMTVISLITLTMLLMVILSPSEEELHEDAELVAKLELRRRAAQQEQLAYPAPPMPMPQQRRQAMQGRRR
jgi:hypothetical protein